MQIKFEYQQLKGIKGCWKKTRWGGCCCECRYHMAVNKHCSVVPHKEKGCICKQFLGFYICSMPSHVEPGSAAQVMSKHGFCEMYETRKKKTRTLCPQ
jgi:hypothetical protein